MEPQPPKPVTHAHDPDVLQHTPAAPEPQMDKTQKTEKPDNVEYTSSAQGQKQMSAVKTLNGQSQKCVETQKKPCSAYYFYVCHYMWSSV